MEYVKKGMLSAALETVQEALRKDPKFLDARLMLAGLFSTLRDLDSANVEYDRILKQDPGNEEALVYRAQILVEAGRNDEAIRLLKGFLKKQPDSAVSWYYLGRVHQKLDKKEDAIRSYRKAADLRPGFAQAGLALGWTLEDSNRSAEALAAYQRLYDDAQDTTAANRIATLLLKQEKYREALPYLEVVEAADADDMNVRVKLGLVYMELKRLDRAESIFKTILARTPDADRVRYYLASVYEEQKRLDDSIAEVMKIQPGSKLHGDAVVHAGWLLKQAGRSTEALDLVAKAAKLNPGHATFYLFMASIEEDAKRFTAASQVLQAAVKIFPEDEKMHFYLGSLLDRQGDVDGCLLEMERVLKLNPDHVEALNYLGYTWTIRGTRLNDAERLIRRALALKPDNGFVQDSWGWHLFLRGRIRESIVELEKAARLKPNEATILEHLADAYLRYNLREKAVSRYQEAARLAQDEGARRKIESKLDLLQIEVAERTNEQFPPAVAEAAGRSPAGETAEGDGN
jgi:tetratricopeptide (TPR) repeat protein